MTDYSLDVWENEGGRTKTPISPALIRYRLRKYLPEFVYSYFDSSYFWKSLEKYEKGDVIEHEGKKWEVRYCWMWLNVFGVAIYFSELDPLGESE